MDVIKVIIADDHQMFRDGIKALLADESIIEVVDDVGDGIELFDALKTSEAHLVLMDIQMPNRDGITATKELKEFDKDVQILALTMSDDDQQIYKMVEAGASGYILKNTGRNELITAIKAVAGGDSYFSREASQKLFQHLTQHQNSKKQVKDTQLTNREVEILKLIAEELTNQEIADRLFISSRTVDTHRRNLMQKLDVKNSAGLVKYVLKHDL